jgi:hypothetical protein
VDTLFHLQKHPSRIPVSHPKINLKYVGILSANPKILVYTALRRDSDQEQSGSALMTEWQDGHTSAQRLFSLFSTEIIFVVEKKKGLSTTGCASQGSRGLLSAA